MAATLVWSGAARYVVATPGVTAWRHTAHAVFVGDAARRPGLVMVLVLAGLVVAGALVAEATGASAARRSRQRVTTE